MDKIEIRLQILKAVLPQASRVGLGEPDHIVDICTRFEKYVLDSQQTGENLSDSPTKRPPGRPKRTTDNEMNGSPGPTFGG